MAGSNPFDESNPINSHRASVRASMTDKRRLSLIGRGLIRGSIDPSHVQTMLEHDNDEDEEGRRR
jgi:hypothetical protein